MARKLVGIDVSSHDGWPMKSDTAECYRKSDFVIVKATQGTGYTNPLMGDYAKKVEADKKLLGFYHYAGGGDPKAEAEHFYAKVKAHVGKAVMCLDWESYQNGAWGSKTWCRQFCDHFRKLSGVRCLIYVQASAVGQCANCADTYGLWLAGYPDNRRSWVIPEFRYTTGAWPAYDIWQYTSGGETVDRNVSNLSAGGWAQWAKKDAAEPAKDTSVPTKPAEKAKDKAPKLGTYVTTADNLNVRMGPGTDYPRKDKRMLTADGQAHSNTMGQLKKGTRVTVSKVQKDKGGNWWGSIPSGWVCLVWKGKDYVKKA